MEKSTISMAMFNSFLYVYQRDPGRVLPSQCLHEIGRAVDLALLVALIPSVGNSAQRVVQHELGVPGSHWQNMGMGQYL